MKFMNQNLSAATWLRALFCVGTLACVTAVYALEVYQWEDEKGQLNVSDVVPAKYKKTARRIEVRTPEPAASSVAAAESVKETPKINALSPTVGPKPSTPPVPLTTPTPTTAPTPAPGRTPVPSPTPAPTSSSGSGVIGLGTMPAPSAAASGDCETQQRLYRESQECFAPYRNATGGIKPEAFERCQEVAEPTGQCAPKSQ